MSIIKFMYETHCRHFKGDRPCHLNEVCNFHCPHLSVPRHRILVVHLEAMGAVLRATSLLPALKRKYPSSHITWVTQKPSQALLENNPYIDRILTTSSEDLLALSALNFDYAFCIDKSLKAGGVLKQTEVRKVFGFKVESRSGAVVPASDAAKELWYIGLSNQKKFYENQKTEAQLIAESLELQEFYHRDPYVLVLTEAERELVQVRRKGWASKDQIVVGLNTGCADTIPYKKLTVAYHRRLIEQLLKRDKVKIVLLGGPGDHLRNERIAAGFPQVIETPVDRGLRDGLCSVAACDIVVSGDSLGMHMAIALNKWVVAWFGPTCAQEIDLFGRGRKVQTLAGCSPCWKRACHQSTMCYDLAPIEDILSGIEEGISCTTSSFKQPSLETSFSPSL